MRHTTTENVSVLGKFDTSDTVTITITKISDESSVTLDSNSCNEIGTTGIFKWNSSDITTAPTTFTEYLWIMTNSTYSQYGKIVLGGYVDNIDAAISSRSDLSVNDVMDEALAGHTTTDSLAVHLKNLLKVQKNKWEIVSNQMIIYDDDKTTPLYTFDLKDELDSATMINVFKREPV